MDVPDRAALALPGIPGNRILLKARELPRKSGELIVPRIWFNFREAADICVRVPGFGKHKRTRVARLPAPAPFRPFCDRNAQCLSDKKGLSDKNEIRLDRQPIYRVMYFSWR